MKVPVGLEVTLYSDCLKGKELVVESDIDDMNSIQKIEFVPLSMIVRPSSEWKEKVCGSDQCTDRQMLLKDGTCE
jgi:hypothetical protein